MTQAAVDYLFPPNPQTPPPASLCLFANPSSCPTVTNFNAAPPHYFYWDAEHPTTIVHKGLADFLYNLLQ
jgi:phospholipase/lecithinase/hemolysin